MRSRTLDSLIIVLSLCGGVSMTMASDPNSRTPDAAKPLRAEEIIELGQTYAKRHKILEASRCYSEANKTPAVAPASLIELVFAWEELLGQDPENFSCHLGLAETLEKQGHYEQAGVHYRKAMAIARTDQDRDVAQRALTRILESERSNSKVSLTIEQQKTAAELSQFRSNILSHWTPAEHEGLLLTRCWVRVNQHGEAKKLMIAVTSGSRTEDESVIRALKSTPFREAYELLGSGLYDFVCVSEGGSKFVDFSHHQSF